MGLSNYPPGHPTGVNRELLVITCPKCGETKECEYEYDRAVNAGDFIGDPDCETEGCGEELGELDSWEPA